MEIRNYYGGKKKKKKKISQLQSEVQSDRGSNGTREDEFPRKGSWGGYREDHESAISTKMNKIKMVITQCIRLGAYMPPVML